MYTAQIKRKNKSASGASGSVERGLHGPQEAPTPAEQWLQLTALTNAELRTSLSSSRLPASAGRARCADSPPDGGCGSSGSAGRRGHEERTDVRGSTAHGSASEAIFVRDSIFVSMDSSSLLSANRFGHDVNEHGARQSFSSGGRSSRCLSSDRPSSDRRHSTSACSSRLSSNRHHSTISSTLATILAREDSSNLTGEFQEAGVPGPQTAREGELRKLNSANSTVGQQGPAESDVEQPSSCLVPVEEDSCQSAHEEHKTSQSVMTRRPYLKSSGWQRVCKYYDGMKGLRLPDLPASPTRGPVGAGGPRAGVVTAGTRPMSMKDCIMNDSTINSVTPGATLTARRDWSTPGVEVEQEWWKDYRSNRSHSEGEPETAPPPRVAAQVRGPRGPVVCVGGHEDDRQNKDGQNKDKTRELLGVSKEEEHRQNAEGQQVLQRLLEKADQNIIHILSPRKTAGVEGAEGDKAEVEDIRVEGYQSMCGIRARERARERMSRLLCQSRQFMCSPRRGGATPALNKVKVSVPAVSNLNLVSKLWSRDRNSDRNNSRREGNKSGSDRAKSTPLRGHEHTALPGHGMFIFILMCLFHVEK